MLFKTVAGGDAGTAGDVAGVAGGTEAGATQTLKEYSHCLVPVFIPFLIEVTALDTGGKFGQTNLSFHTPGTVAVASLSWCARPILARETFTIRIREQ